MFPKENALLERFIRGLTLFAGQLELNNLIRYLDGNITAEQFVCRLMNILYDTDYRSDNGTDGLTPGYDLISTKENEVIQVSRTASTTKIRDAVKKLRNAIGDGRLEARRYTLRFVFLVNDASDLKAAAAAKEAQNDPNFSFDPSKDILDFKHFAATVKTEFQFVPEKTEQLRRFMDYCCDIFPRDGIPAPAPTDRVEEVISEYARNFDEPLFMHQYSEQPVTLRKLYVDPAFYHSKTLSQNIAGCLSEYICKTEYNKERFFFIEGSAAIGKTSLASWLCWHYQNHTETAKEILKGRKLVCVRLRELEFQGIRDAEKVLLKYLDLPDVKAFDARYPGALLVLDGADELRMVSDIPRGDVEGFLLRLQNVFRSHKFLITTRPQSLDMGKFDSNIFLYRKIELAHYDETMRAAWLDRYLACGQTIPPNTERFIRELQGREENGVADTPLALYLLAQCDAESDLLVNPWALYHRIFSEAILKGEYNANFAKSGDLMDAHNRGINYRVVQSIAFHIFQNAAEERYYLNESEIMEAIGECDLEDLTPEQVRKTCVLCAYWKNVGTIGALEFYHNNIRDFFLCEYLCQHLLDCLREPEPVEALVPMLCRVLCHADICRSTWKQVYKYLCLRLDYESVQKQHTDSLYHLLQDRKDQLCWILPRVVTGVDLWNTSEDLQNTKKKRQNAEDNLFVYRRAKQTFRNIYMLVRILQSFCSEKIELTHRTLSAPTLYTMALLRDWNDILRTPEITFTGHDGKSQTIDAVSDTIYRNLDFSDRRISQVFFQRCNMNVANFQSSFMDRILFSNSALNQVRLNNATVVDGSFYSTDIHDIKALQVTLTNTIFTKVTLHNITGRVHLRQCLISPSTRLETACLESSSFDDVTIAGIHVEDANLEAIRFKAVILKDSSIRKMHLHTAFFDGTIQNVVFEDSQFKNCSYKRPDTFGNVTFRNCSFQDVSFRNMDLSGVTFENCGFTDCDIPQLPES